MSPQERRRSYLTTWGGGPPVQVGKGNGGGKEGGGGKGGGGKFVCFKHVERGEAGCSGCGMEHVAGETPEARFASLSAEDQERFKR